MDVEPVVRGAEHVEEGGSGLNVTGVKLGNRVIQSGQFILVSVSVSVSKIGYSKMDIQTVPYCVFIMQITINYRA